MSAQVNSSTVTWGQRASARQVGQTRMADTAANRQRLVAQAGRDRTPSAVVAMNGDVALLSGTALETASRVARTAAPAMTAGQWVGVDGQWASVLYTDDGLAEIDASRVIVAVVDTGMDVTHPALRNHIVDTYNSYDGSRNVTDNNGHGTHVAGTIAGTFNDQSAATGVATTAKLMAVKACGPNGVFTDATISDGIIYAAQHGARVINLSLQDTTDLPRTAMAIEYANLMNVVVIAASGNEGANRVAAPAVYNGVVAVGSSANGRRSSFSNGGDRLDLSAPGENIVSSTPGGGLMTRSGTSMASPYVAGAAALVIAQHPDWSAEQVKAQLKRSVNDVGRPGKDIEFGYGELNLFKAVFGGAEIAGPARTGNRFLDWLKGLLG